MPHADHRRHIVSSVYEPRTPKSIVVGTAHGAVIAIPEDWAYEFAPLKEALEKSATWHEFAQSCPPERLGRDLYTI